MKRFKTFPVSLEILLSPPFHGSEPQYAIELNAKQAPPFEFHDRQYLSAHVGVECRQESAD